jgi:transposase
MKSGGEDEDTTRADLRQLVRSLVDQNERLSEQSAQLESEKTELLEELTTLRQQLLEETKENARLRARLAEGAASNRDTPRAG